MKNSKLMVLLLSATAFFITTSSSALQQDFKSTDNKWVEISDSDHSGEQKLLTIKKDGLKEQIYLYWMGPGAESGIQEHSKSEEVIIVQGSLYWLNENKSIQKKLEVGDYVDRKPHIMHGPFKAGPSGCLMYVRFH